MSRNLDDIINELSIGFVPKEKPIEAPQVSYEKTKEIDFFFGKIQKEHYSGSCPRCLKDMRIHLSTFVCDECESIPIDRKDLK